MNRFKFRLWDADNRRMVVSFDINVIVEYISISDSYINTLGVDDKVDLGKNSTLMQWSGLRDANGKDIFEGDIVICDFNEHDTKQLGEVIFENGKFVIVFRYIPWDEERSKLFTYSVSSINKQVKVVGNKYEN